MASEQIWGQPEEKQEREILCFPLISNNNNTICFKYAHSAQWKINQRMNA